MPLRVVRLGGRISLVLMCLGDTASYRRVKYGLSCRRDVAAEGALLLRLSGCRDCTTVPHDFTSFQHSATAESVTQDRHVSVSYYGTI